jgi:DNA-binding Xre family transcriptional regulator
MRVNLKTVKFALAQKCWDEKDLAAAMGVPQSVLHYSLSKARDVRPKTIGRIARALGVSVGDVGIFDEDTPIAVSAVAPVSDRLSEVTEAVSVVSQTAKVAQPIIKPADVYQRIGRVG